MLRRLIPYAVLPLALVACALANSPWLRAFPSGVVAVPLFGAAVLSVLVPVIVVGIGARRLWVSGLVDLVIFVFYELLVTLRAPDGFGALWTGLVHGPSQILTFALPLVSPRSLLVAPVALCWLAGAILGECIARGWQSVVPYGMQLVAFGLAYAGTARAITSSSDGRRYDTLMAGALLLTLLLMRAAQTWVGLERGAEATQVDGRLPLRGLGIGAVSALVVALAAAAVVQASAFEGPPTTPNRTPPVNTSEPLTPDAFVGGLRPDDPASRGRALFTVGFDRATTNYVSIANLDSYDATGWDFSRTFRPSGGVVPGDPDPTLHPRTAPVTQQYTIDAGPMTDAPWMPYLNRVVKVSGIAITIDPDSGMIVPAHHLTAGSSYTVQSVAAQTLFGDLRSDDIPSLSATDADLSLNSQVSTQVQNLVQTLSTETGIQPSSKIAFLQAVAQQFRTKDALSGGPATAAASPPATSSSVAPSSSPAPHSSPSRGKQSTPRGRTSSHPSRPAAPTSPTAAPSSSPSSTQREQAGGTGFADVLASIRQNRSATPEQYATLMALIARAINVPARLATGFRIPVRNGSATLPAGRYTVTTKDAWTWVEVPISGVGWVVLDPSPGTYSGQSARNQSAPPTTSPSPTPTNVVSISRGQTQQTGAYKPSPPKPGTHVSGWVVVLVVVIVVLVLLALFVVGLLLRKWLRARRRRTTGDPRHRLVGAWQEGLDVLAESGLADLETLTSAEVEKVTADRFGDEPGAQARYLGDAANGAIFGPAAGIQPADADAAWNTQVALRRSVRRRLAWRARVGASLRYHRPDRTVRPTGPSSWATEHQARLERGVDDDRRRRRAGGTHRRR